MKKSKIYIVFIISLLIIISGVFMVNVQYTKSNNRTVAKSMFATMQGDENNIKLSYNALYGEINILNKEDNKLSVYLNLAPFDIRFGFGNKILYINSSIFNHKSVK